MKNLYIYVKNICKIIFNNIIYYVFYYVANKNKKDLLNVNNILINYIKKIKMITIILINYI